MKLKTLIASKNISFFSVVFLFISAIILLSCESNVIENKPQEIDRLNFPNVLNITNTPQNSIDWDSFCFSDKGAWFGFALPENTRACFTGPFLMTNGEWIGKSLIDLNFKDLQQNKIPIISGTSTYYPGILVNEISYSDFRIKMSLVFIDNQSALVNVEFTDITRNQTIIPIWSGSSFNNEGIIKSSSNGIDIVDTTEQSRIKIIYEGFQEEKDVFITDTTFYCSTKEVEIKENTSFNLIISYSDKNIHNPRIYSEEQFSNAKSILKENQNRWNNYLNNALTTNAKWGDKKEYQTIAVKSVMTLINNWRSPYGDLLHDGLFPSYAVDYFNGFWAWDSWKHSVALVTFEPELAKNQIRAMYDYQNQDGMIPDCIYADKYYNNWLNTKPPLSGWAIWEVYLETGDTTFLKEMYPKLIDYHEWWYKFRDINKNYLCEYGSSDGSLIAAKWESGMDNAIRFDNSAITKIDETNYAFDQESVDLNSYLYLEKIIISQIADVLNDTENKEKYLSDSERLKELIEQKMFDGNSGYYYDINTNTGAIVNKQGPDGWSPLFVNLSSKKHAESAIQIMMDTNKFSTYIPFPTAPKDDSKFSEGYWRGPIWMDQVYFAIKALKNYDRTIEAETYTLQVFDRLEGLKKDSPIRENYWPLDGKGMRVNHFSWSAAHLLLLYQD